MTMMMTHLWPLALPLAASLCLLPAMHLIWKRMKGLNRLMQLPCLSSKVGQLHPMEDDPSLPGGPTVWLCDRCGARIILVDPRRGDHDTQPMPTTHLEDDTPTDIALDTLSTQPELCPGCGLPIGNHPHTDPDLSALLCNSWYRQEE